MMRNVFVALAFCLAGVDGTAAGQWRVQFVVPIMKGKLGGDAIDGVAQIGNLGEGPLTARRTAEE